MNGVNYAEALVKARRYEITNESVEETVDTTNVAESVLFLSEGRIENGKKVAGEVVEKGREAIANTSKTVSSGANKLADSKVGQFASKHKNALAGAGIAAAAAGAALAAKNIHDKKKAAKEAGDAVKENFEYDGYDSVVEVVISNFMSEEEIMSENAHEIATKTADFMIENINNLF